jgi:hypothetical protein
MYMGIRVSHVAPHGPKPQLKTFRIGAIISVNQTANQTGA